MAKACASSVPVEDNPGAVLGVIMGVCGNNGRDKVTLITSPAIHHFGAWLEQLLAESTGKEGKGLIPVDREALADPALYGKDRLFVYLRVASEADATQDARVAALEAAGHPVVRIDVQHPYDLGAEFFRWEFATARGSVLGINTFNQPDVEASKGATRRLTTEYEKTGKLPPEQPLRIGDANLGSEIKAHLARIKPGDYVALLAYIEMTDANEAALQKIRTAIRDRYKVATCVGFGPRFLHSTGQAYKGGPNSGVFLQITCDDAADLRSRARRHLRVVKAARRVVTSSPPRAWPRALRLPWASSIQRPATFADAIAKA